MEEWLKHQPLLSVTERRWVVENCKTLRDVWDKGSPEMVIYVAGLPGMMDNYGEEFAIDAALGVVGMVADDRIKDFLRVRSRKFYYGDALPDRVATALSEARQAADELATRLPESAAAWAADAVLQTGLAAGLSAAKALSRAAGAAAATEAWVAARADQAMWLRDFCAGPSPNQEPSP